MKRGNALFVFLAVVVIVFILFAFCDCVKKSGCTGDKCTPKVEQTP